MRLIFRQQKNSVLLVSARVSFTQKLDRKQETNLLPSVIGSSPVLSTPLLLFFCRDGTSQELGQKPKGGFPKLCFSNENLVSRKIETRGLERDFGFRAFASISEAHAIRKYPCDASPNPSTTWSDQASNAPNPLSLARSPLSSPSSSFSSPRRRASCPCFYAWMRECFFFNGEKCRFAHK